MTGAARIVSRLAWAALALPLALVAQTDESAKLPGAALERDTSSLLSATRIAALPAPAREQWTRYLSASHELKAKDQAVMEKELAALGRTKMTRAPFAREAFTVESWMTDAWFATDSARQMAENILSFQTPSGGWSKHVDFTAGPRQPGQSWFSENESWQYIATIDNSSTTEQMRFLARAFAVRGDVRYRDAFLRGLRYLSAAQYPNGCWPQVYPLQGGYHDAATFNDDATANVLRVLRDVAKGEPAFVPARDRERAAASVARGVECLVDAQVVVGGTRTVWGQQHDPLTLEPVNARSYEPASLSGKESAGITLFLMALPTPDARTIAAVHAAADWFRENAIYGYTYAFDTGLEAKAGAGPIWARMSEIGTNRPIFMNRDGVKHYRWDELTDRRQGYGWYGAEPAAVLRKYDGWAHHHPRVAATGEG